MSDAPVIAAKSPARVEVKAGKTYLWCACGRSKTQPFCDQSHRGTSIRPIPYKAEEDGEVWFCRCKQSGHKPLCDGTHKTL